MNEISEKINDNRGAPLKTRRNIAGKGGVG